MKTNNRITIPRLKEIGFEVLNDDWKLRNGVDEYESPLYHYEGFIYSLGHSRRGQIYYILIVESEVFVFASKPDGSPGILKVPEQLKNILNEIA